MGQDDSSKKARAALRAARRRRDTELRWGDLEWSPSSIPDEIETLDALESLDVNAEAITDFWPLAKFTQLRALGIYSVRDVDLTPLGRLRGLQTLQVTGDGVTNLEFIRPLTDLDSLVVQGPIDDWGPLSGLAKLKHLAIQSDDQTDIAPLSRLSRLESLSMTDGDVSDLSPLSRLTKLQVLEFYWGFPKDIRPLASLTSLKKLKLYATYEVTDLSPLFGLTNLRRVELSDCTGLSHQEVDRLRAALPKCEVR
ncbi:leucine-rich repeat domain-containing protein [Alienimonas chondri]|uniref:Leucine-rich repeat domain-containing protein n=1 Tax=Alienimonas chondri TaxID=2681879 RepID=A0ABX1VDB0_9PLAN|nr:hypothetical protein [Alienimonas chondri]NNJ26095.1 hypothetical protein [Alienimonas chondri]